MLWAWWVEARSLSVLVRTAFRCRSRLLESMCSRRMVFAGKYSGGLYGLVGGSGRACALLTRAFLRGRVGHCKRRRKGRWRSLDLEVHTAIFSSIVRRLYLLVGSQGQLQRGSCLQDQPEYHLTVVSAVARRKDLQKPHQ